MYYGCELICYLVTHNTSINVLPHYTPSLYREFDTAECQMPHSRVNLLCQILTIGRSYNMGIILPLQPSEVIQSAQYAEMDKFNK